MSAGKNSVEVAEREKLPLYRHKYLYADNESYQKCKFFTNDDFKLQKHLWNLECAGEDDYEFAHGPPYEREAYQEWRYEDRYHRLKSDTRFYRNMKVLEKIRHACGSYSEYVLKTAVHGIEQSKADFALLYVWFARKKFFLYDFWTKNADGPNAYSTLFMNEAKEWECFSKMCKDAFRNGHKGCCKYQEFIDRELA